MSDPAALLSPSGPAQALAGVRELDLARALVGPGCKQTRADLIKVDKMAQPDTR